MASHASADTFKKPTVAGAGGIGGVAFAAGQQLPLPQSATT
jgi:hypothetical protein